MKLLTIIVLLAGLGASGQTRSSGFIAIPEQDYYKMRDSIKYLNDRRWIETCHCIDLLQMYNRLSKENDSLKALVYMMPHYEPAFDFGGTYVSAPGLVGDTLKFKPKNSFITDDFSGSFGGNSVNPINITPEPCNPDSTHGLNMFRLQRTGYNIRIDQRGVYGRYNDVGKWVYLGNFATQKEGGDTYIFDIPRSCPDALNHNQPVYKKVNGKWKRASL